MKPYVLCTARSRKSSNILDDGRWGEKKAPRWENILSLAFCKMRFTIASTRLFVCVMSLVQTSFGFVREKCHLVALRRKRTCVEVYKKRRVNEINTCHAYHSGSAGMRRWAVAVSAAAWCRCCVMTQRTPQWLQWRIVGGGFVSASLRCCPAD